MWKTILFVGGLFAAALGFYLANRQPHARPALSSFAAQIFAEMPAGISFEEARAAALEARPGEITSQKFERAPGGHARFSFEIASGKRSYRVAVDAHSGEVMASAQIN